MDPQTIRHDERIEACLRHQLDEAVSDEFEIHLDELIEAYLRHQLDEAVSDKFETHLLGCQGCTRLLEQMQSLRDGLEEKAPSIRLAAPKPRSFLLRWQTAAVAFALLLIVSAGMLQLWKGKKEPVAVAVRPQPRPEVHPQEVPPAPVPESPAPQTESAHTHSPGKKPAELLHSDKSPFNVNGTAPAPQTEETTLADSSKSEPPGNTTPPGETPPNGAKPSDASPSSNALRLVAEVPAWAHNPQIEIKIKTTAQGVELFQIGTVEPPPFSFSGFGKHAMDPKGIIGKSHSQGELAPDTGRALFKQGMNAYVDGRYDDAIGFLQSAALKDKKSDDINFYLGVSQILAGHPQEAVTPFGNVIAPGKSSLIQSAHYYLGKAYVQQLKLAEAEAEFRAAAALPGRVTADSNALLARTIALRAQLEANDKPPSIR